MNTQVLVQKCTAQELRIDQNFYIPLRHQAKKSAVITRGTFGLPDALPGRMKLLTVVGWILSLAMVLATLAVSEARAADQHLFSVASEIKKEIINVRVRTDDATGEIIGMYVAEDYYKADEIRAGTNLRLDGIDREDALHLKTNQFDTNTGGTLTITFLKNGKDGVYRTFNIALYRKGDAWKAYAPGDDRPIVQLFMKRQSWLGITVGIAAIKPIVG